MSRVMAIELAFDMGATVFLKHDPDQSPRMITAVQLGCNGSTAFGLSCGLVFSWHGASEISTEKTIINEFKRD